MVDCSSGEQWISWADRKIEGLTYAATADELTRWRTEDPDDFALWGPTPEEF